MPLSRPALVRCGRVVAPAILDILNFEFSNSMVVKLRAVEYCFDLRELWSVGLCRLGAVSFFLFFAENTRVQNALVLFLRYYSRD